MNETIDSPDIVPSPKKPRETPSVPCAIIRVPATWKMWILVPDKVVDDFNRTISPRSLRDEEDPFIEQASTVEFSVIIKISVLTR